MSDSQQAEFFGKLAVISAVVAAIAFPVAFGSMFGAGVGWLVFALECILVVVRSVHLVKQAKQKDEQDAP